MFVSNRVKNRDSNLIIFIFRLSIICAVCALYTGITTALCSLKQYDAEHKQRYPHLRQRYHRLQV